MTRIPLVLAALLLAGCSGSSISGEVDGRPVSGVKSAVFDRVEFGFWGFTIDATVLLLSDMKDGCEVVDDFTRVRDDDCVDTCADFGEIGEERLGKDRYWWKIVALNPYDTDVGTYAYDSDFDDAGDFTASFSSMDFSDIYDSDTCEDLCNANNDVIEADDEEATGGTVTVDEYENNVEMKGSLAVEYPGDDELSGKFAAEYCDLDDFVAMMFGF